jgi:hypothetical protein
MDPSFTAVAAMLTGAGIALVSSLLTLLVQHALSLRADRIRRQRDRDEQRRQASGVEAWPGDKPTLNHAQVKELLQRVNKEMAQTAGLFPQRAPATEAQIRQFMRAANVDVTQMLSSVGPEGTIELLSIRIVRWLQDPARRA